MRLALPILLILAAQAGTAAGASFLFEVRQITADNPPFSRNVYGCVPACTVEDFAAVTAPAGFEKASAKLFLPTEATANLPTPPDGVAAGLDLIPGIPGNDFVFIAQLLSATIIGFDPTFGAFALASVERDTRFRYAAGEVVHEAIDTDGNHYVLQAIALDLLDVYDPTVVDGLAEIPLPAGWSYTSSVLTQDLVADSGGLATVFAQGQLASWQQFTVVPEPGTMVLIAGSLIALASRRRP